MDVDLSMLLIRLALGPMLVAHGWNKLAGPGGIGGTEQWFEALGVRPARLHARLAAGTEILAGTAITLGALTWAAGTAYVGLMLVAALTDHRGKGFFVFKGGWEYTMVVALTSVALVAVGPGRWSVDHLMGWEMAGPVWSLAAAVLGAGAGGLLLAVSYRPSATAGDES
ncbi:hypothetical protein Aple_002180 [Acrocarpospora pleiomorpha]|uniref:DoxX family protein n=1 Tax=Acrocarpospora pleiomorpha TaxID=90975 RepID=A0A5M3XEH0_9ACTN|nr:DoxX family protein [Acrocarpospora pleiomorpha]GES17323.1 hypothetical protein Aple_002180 [Acrocarpospora pleiomorpha]